MSDSTTPTREVEPDLDAELGEIAGQLNVLNARLVEVTERLSASDEWSQHGMRTPAHYLAWRLGMSPERARQVVRVAEHRRSFPTIIGAFERGELALEQVVEVVRAPAWADAQLLDIATISTVTKLRRAMRSTMFDGEPNPTDGPIEPPTEPTTAPTPPVDRLSFGVTDAGRWRLNGDFGLDTGRRIEAALTERKDARFTDGDETVTWADALADCCARSLDTIESPSRRDHYRTWIHIDVTAGQATTTDGWHIPMALAHHVLCDGIVQPVWERDGTPFSVGRSHRIVPDRTRRIIERRDRGCRVPGCTGDRFVEIHHIRHWLDGGTTDTANLVSLCPKHHKLHHLGELGIAGNADKFNDLVFTTSRGSPLPGSAPPTTSTTPPPKPVRPYEPALRGRFDWNWIGLGWTHPDEMKRRQTRWRTPHDEQSDAA
ncbi:MAG: DUF222 domain-containing protein [Ilumatobacteraceae bacterium]